jgi:hypothetical protein
MYETRLISTPSARQIRAATASDKCGRASTCSGLLAYRPNTQERLRQRGSSGIPSNMLEPFETGSERVPKGFRKGSERVPERFANGCVTVRCSRKPSPICSQEVIRSVRGVSLNISFFQQNLGRGAVFRFALRSPSTWIAVGQQTNRNPVCATSVRLTTHANSRTAKVPLAEARYRRLPAVWLLPVWSKWAPPEP